MSLATVISVEELLQRDPDTVALFDVRSPSEYVQGHLPRAVSMPLFTDDERASVGKFYKTEGPDAAMTLGLQYAGPKLQTMLQQAQETGKDRLHVVHCWTRGKTQ